MMLKLRKSPFGRLVTRPTNDMLVGSAMRMTCPDDAHD